MFLPFPNKDLNTGYPEIANAEERKIKSLFKAEESCKGASGVLTMRKQVFFFFFSVVSCLI